MDGDFDTLASDFGFGRRGKSNRKGFSFNDVFGGPPEHTLGSGSNSNNGRKQYSTKDFDYDSVFKPSALVNEPMNNGGSSRPSSFPVYDGLQGLKMESAVTSLRSMPESSRVSVSIGSSKLGDFPFEVLESSSVPGCSLSSIFPHLLDDRSKLAKSMNARPETSSGSGGVYDDLDLLNSFRKGVQSSSSLRDNGWKNDGPSRSTTPQSATSREHKENNFFGYSESNIEKKIPVDNFQGPPSFHVPSVAAQNAKYFGQAVSPLHNETNSRLDMSPKSGQGQQSDDVWLTVSVIPLRTQATTAPPPSRTPPPIPHQPSRPETGSISSSSEKKAEEFSSTSTNSQYFQSSKMAQSSVKNPMISRFDELQDFVMGRSRNIVDESVNHHVAERSHAFSGAAAMKDAMDKVEAKFRYAKKVCGQEHAKVARNKVSMQPEKDKRNELEREFKETQESLDCEKKQNDVEGRETRILEKVMERLWEIKRVKARQAVEWETGEARERTASEARERAAAEARLKTERAAIEKANADAREHATGAALPGAQTKACERAAAEAIERAEKAAAEAKEKEARDKTAAMRAEAAYRRQAERAAVERAASEARERAATEARERAAAAVKMNQQNGDTDLESFFSMGRASSAPRAPDPMFDQQFQSKAGSGAAKNSSSTGASFNLKKASSTTNIVDNLSSVFGAGPSSGEFHEVEGETEERRRARMDRHQRTKERAAKALAEKNQRDLLAQREQEERHRIADTLDIEIKRWAAGKEGNLRALLSTMQYVLWPECGWQPVSLTDLIMGASVKKMYRKATLFIHPDKVLQRGATLEQKYIAEKVFDLLKEAWNQFNLEEHF